ncbi:MAG: DUF721 domain-containing protein [Bdellovibrionales bacterium]|nr:DUF721 domain-containing protein [Bdellovibrionales bacterium]
MADDKKKRRELLPASKVLQTLLANGKSPLSDQFLRWKIWRFWTKIVGPTLGTHCEPVGYERGRLIVWVKSSARMQEIRFFEKTLKEKVNEHVGRDWVKGIRFTLDRRGLPQPDQVSDQFKGFLDSE